MTPLIDAIKRAHNISGAPGSVVGFYANGHYQVRVPITNTIGEVRVFRFNLKSDRVTVYPSWSIAGERQRKQATVKLER